MQYYICLFFSFFSFVSFAQNSISGRVVDSNKNTLPGATIYFDGTTFSTVADDDGKFILYYTTKSNAVLVVSYIGFETQYFKNVDNLTDLIIQLNQSDNALQEVVISKKDKFSRAQKLKIFREQFLGKTKNSKKSKIINESELILNYNEITHTLHAKSYEPLQIINEALGYKMSYELLNFEVNFWKLSIHPEDATRSFYAGLCRFEEIATSQKIIKARKMAFEGSQIHFFRNLVAQIWGKNNFVLLKDKLQDDPKNNFKITDAGEFKKIEVTNQADLRYENSFRANFIVLYNSEEQSAIRFDTPFFYVDKFGNNSDIDKITFSGKLAEFKVADMLPLNYGLE